MPALARRADAVEVFATQLARRNWSRDGSGSSPISSTAIGFLVPVFVVLFFAPILCVYCVRRRRGTPPAPLRSRKPPALDRTEAREKLRAVTEVIEIASDKNPKTHIEEKIVPDSVSFLEKECAICLSTLHAPSPPEPAKLSEKGELSDGATTASVKSLCISNQDEILRLKSCAHEFHAECLVSWFVVRKTSCPICRAVYNEDVEKNMDELAQTPPPAVQEEARPPPPTVQPVSNWYFFWTGRDRVESQQRGTSRSGG